MTDQEFHLRKLIDQLERENAALKQQCETCEMKQVFDSYVRDNAELRVALSKIATDPVTAVTYYEVKWQQIARDALKSND